MNLSQKLSISLLFIVTYLGVHGSTAFAVERAQAVTSGSTAQSQGTRAASDYEGRAGGPIYEYGKGLQIGPAHFIPSIDYKYAWDNNVFYDENGRKSDYINRLSTGLTGELSLGGGQHVISASYDTYTERFARFDSQNHTDHIVGVGAKLNFVPFSLSVDDRFLRTVDRSGTEFTARVPRDENTVHGLLEIPFAAFFLESEGSYLSEDYRNASESQFVHNDLDLFQRVGIDISGNNQFLVEYGYKNLDYAKNQDRNGYANQFMLGLRGNLTERITYQVWGGAQYRIYDVSSLPDFNGFIMRTAVQYSISDVSTITLRGNRLPQESTFDGQSFYVGNKAELDWRQQIAERIFFHTRESLNYNEYSRITVLNNTERTRRDYVWQTGVGLEYFMPNNLVSFTLDYQINARDSNTALLGYDAQEITAGVRASF